MSKVRACEPSSCPARAEKVGHALNMSALRSFRRLRDLKRAGWKELLDRAGARDRTHLLLPARERAGAPRVWRRWRRYLPPATLRGGLLRGAAFGQGRA